MDIHTHLFQFHSSKLGKIMNCALKYTLENKTHVCNTQNIMF